MYVCESCGGEFSTPKRIRREWIISGFPESTIEVFCPHCGYSTFYWANNCPCGAFKRTSELLCPECKDALRKRFRAILDVANFSELELDQIDEWMDGNSIADFK